MSTNFFSSRYISKENGSFTRWLFFLLCLLLFHFRLPVHAHSLARSLAARSVCLSFRFVCRFIERYLTIYAIFCRFFTNVCVCVCDLYHFAEHLLLAFRRFAHVQSAYTQIYMKINRFKSGKCKLYACAAAAVVEPMAKIFQLNDTESRERLTLFDFQRKMNEFFFLW